MCLFPVCIPCSWKWDSLVYICAQEWERIMAGNKILATKPSKIPSAEHPPTAEERMWRMAFTAFVYRVCCIDVASLISQISMYCLTDSDWHIFSCKPPWTRECNGMWSNQLDYIRHAWFTQYLHFVNMMHILHIQVFTVMRMRTWKRKSESSICV